MFKLSYWNTKTKTKGSRIPITVNGLRVISLAMDLNQAYILDVEINPALQDLWCELADNPFAGVLLESGECQIAFVKSNEREERYRHGRHVIRFYSSIWGLTNCSLQNVTGYIQSSDLKGVISDIDPDYSFVFLSGNQPVNFDAGIPANNYELLRDLCFANGWSFRENGIDSSGRTEILVGDFRDIKEFGSGKKYDRIVLKYDPSNQFTPTKWSDDLVYLEDFRATYNRNFCTHIYSYSNPIEGFNSETFTDFTNGGYQFVDPNFPLKLLPDGKWYVENTEAYNKIEQCKRLTKVVQYQQQTSIDLYNNNDDSIANVEYNEDDILEQMYKDAVSRLRRSSETISYTFTIRYLDLILPGTCLDIEIKHWAKDYDGWEKQVFDVEEIRYARNILYNEQELAALMC